MDENELVNRLTAIGWKGTRGVIIGPGDDAAVLRGGLVVCSDLMVENVHFRFDWVPPLEAGFRAGAAALSDLAAMGAEPVTLLVSLAVPEPRLAEELQRGVRRAGERAGVYIAGGDVSRSPALTVIDVVAVGRAKRPLRRDGATAGESLWVSGALGGSAAAVAAWSCGSSPAAAARGRFALPPNRIPLGRALADAGVARSMIDLSDGLAGDAWRLARASGVRLTIWESRVPADETAGVPLSLALQGGEDYELMFTADTTAEARVLAIGRKLSVPLTRIGRASPGEGVVLVREDGRRAPLRPGGYDHFAKP